MKHEAIVACRYGRMCTEDFCRLDFVLLTSFWVIENSERDGSFGQNVCSIRNLGYQGETNRSQHDP